MGVTIPPLPDVLDESNPVATLQAHGFRIIQARSTHRRVRKVVAATDTEPLAEMDIDAIQYEIGERVIACYEVEIEASGVNAQLNIEYCTSHLLSTLDNVLRR